MGRQMDRVTAILGLLVLFGLVVVYLLPSIIAAERGHMSSGAIFALNLLAGWTALGWLAALVWSLTADTRDNRYPAAAARPDAPG